MNLITTPDSSPASQEAVRRTATHEGMQKWEVQASGLAESFGHFGFCQCAWKTEEYEALWFAEEQTDHGNPEHGSASEAEARAQKVKYPSASRQEGMQDSRCQRKPKSQPWQPLDSRQWLQSHFVQLLLADPFGFAKIDYGARDDVSARPSSTHGGPPATCRCTASDSWRGKGWLCQVWALACGATAF